MKKEINYFSKLLCAFLLCAGIAFTSCEVTEPIVDDNNIEQEGNENNENEGEQEPEKEPENNDGQETPELEDLVTLALDEVTATTASFTGHLNIDAASVASAKVTVYYSDAATFAQNTAKKAYIRSFDDNQNFTVKLTNLKHSANYNYQVTLDVKPERTEGEVLSFATSNVTFDDVKVTVQTSEAEIAAVISGVSEEDESLLKVGFIYSDQSEKVEAGTATKVNASAVAADRAFSHSLKKLTAGTKYYYSFYVLQDQKYSYGEVLEFTTEKHVYDAQQNLDISSATDLSELASSNCYIVSESGLYKFRAVKGNSSESVGSAVSASILWETFGTSEAPEYLDLIKAFCYKDGYMAFQTADTFKEGNAVIAAKDESGKILWSWHIWMTDYPDSQEYYNNAGTVMDRNLGATSATPGDVETLGLQYQWGRKDPFLGSSSIASNDVAKSTIDWPVPAQSNSTRGKIEFAIENPTTFITANDNNYDWHFSGTQMAGETDRWLPDSKTIYDPCPAGWRVPAGGENGLWTKAAGSESDIYGYPFDNTNKGMNFSGKFGSAETIWYPVSGFRNASSGSLIQVGEFAYYWSGSPWPYPEYYAGTHMFCIESSGHASPYHGADRAVGQAVRCVKE